MLSAYLLPAVAHGVPVVFVSPGDDGVSGGIAEVVEGAGATNLDLWFDPGEAAFNYALAFEADAGLAMLGFSAEGGDQTVSFLPGAGTLAVFGGSFSASTTDPIRIGRLTVAGSAVGAELRLANLAGVAFPAFTDGGFGLTPVPVPQTLAAVVAAPTDPRNPIPEPGSVLLLAAGGLLVACSLRRVAR